MTLWLVALLVATSLHAGFQLTVTVVVYPALTAIPAAQWPKAHERHSHTITPLVVLVYGSVLLACGGALWSARTNPGVWLAGSATAAAFAVTAFRAAPLHSRLGRLGAQSELLDALRRSDLLRTVLAVAALVGALVASLA